MAATVESRKDIGTLLTYQGALGEYQRPNSLAAHESYVWDILPARLRVYRKICADARVAPGFSENSWRYFLTRETALQAGASADALMQRDRANLNHDGVAQYRAHVAAQHERMEWVCKIEEVGATRSFPVICTEVGGVNHALYIEVTLLSEDVLRIRINDSWNPFVSRQGSLRDCNSREKVPDVSFTVPRTVVRTRAARRLFLRLLESPRGNLETFHALVLRILHSKSLRRRGVVKVEGNRQTRPIAVQQGTTCYLKNHSRGIAGRLHDAIANEFPKSTPQVCRAKAKDAWRWLKARERQVVAKLINKIGENYES